MAKHAANGRIIATASSRDDERSSGRGEALDYRHASERRVRDRRDAASEERHSERASRVRSAGVRAEKGSRGEGVREDLASHPKSESAEDQLRRGGEVGAREEERLTVSEHNRQFYKHTEYPSKDKIYNWVVDLYTKKGKKWEKSDTFVFSGALYIAYDYAGYLMLFWILWWFVGVLQRTKGEFYAIAFLMIFGLVRLGMILAAIRHGNRLKSTHGKS